MYGEQPSGSGTIVRIFVFNLIWAIILTSLMVYPIIHGNISLFSMPAVLMGLSFLLTPFVLYYTIRTSVSVIKQLKPAEKRKGKIYCTLSCLVYIAPISVYIVLVVFFQ